MLSKRHPASGGVILGSRIIPPCRLLFGLYCCLTAPACSGPSQGVTVEITAAAPGIEQVQFELAHSLTVQADAIAPGVRPGPVVVVYPSEDLLSVEGRWQQEGKQRFWRSQIRWRKGESIRFELGAGAEGVRLLRASG